MKLPQLIDWIKRNHFDGVGAGLILFLLLLAVLTKFIYLGQIPGINADEAYWAVRLRDFSDGVGDWPWAPPTSRLMNPIYPALIWVVNSVFPEGFGYLRLVAVLSHLALLVVAFLTVEKMQKGINKWIFVLLLCALPLHTVFARLAWEPCLIPLFAYLVIYFSIRRQMIFASIALVIGILVHPTLVFLAPLQFILWLNYLMMMPVHGHRRKREWLAIMIVFELIFAAVFYALYKFLNAQNLQGLLPHIFNFEKLIESFAWFFYSVIGVTSFAEFTASDLPKFALNILMPMGLLVLASFMLLARVFLLKRNFTAFFLTIGLLISLILFYVGTYFHGTFAHLNENWAWEPGYQRFILWTSVPVIWILYEALVALKFQKIGAIVLTTAALTYTLSSFFIKAIDQNTFIYPPVYATALVEPKREVYGWIENDIHKEVSLHQPSLTTQILAEDWWLFWPGRYWLKGDDYQFSFYDQGAETFFPKTYRALSFVQARQVLESGGYLVTFMNGPLAQKLREVGLTRYIVHAAKAGDGEDLILIWHARVKSDTVKKGSTP